MLLTKRAHQYTIFQTLSALMKVHPFLMPYLKPQGQCLFKFCITVHSGNFIWYLQKETIKVQNFRLSTAQVKFHQICTLIGSFCWKYIKFRLKKYRGVTSHDIKGWWKIWTETDLLFQKWQEFSEFWCKHSKVSKICTLIGLFRAMYITFDLKNYRGVIFHDTEESC